MLTFTKYRGGSFFPLLLFIAVTVTGNRCVASGVEGEKGKEALWRCVAMKYQGFKGGDAVWGYMPGRLEQEAICRLETGSDYTDSSKKDTAPAGNSAVENEVRKLRLMERICLEGECPGATAAVHSPSLVRNPPRKYLDIRLGASLGSAPHMDTSGARERVPDLLRTLNTGSARKIYHYRRADERLAALCVDPKEDGSCREIVPKNREEDEVKKKSAEKEEGKFRSFMKKVKSSFSGPPPKEIVQWKTRDFYGVRIAETAYAFDYDLNYIGFFARMADHEPYETGITPQYIREVFGTLIRQFGEPAFKLKLPSERPGIIESHAIWITEDGVRIDAICDNPSNDSGRCLNGRISVRGLPALDSAPMSEGAKFFE